MVTIGVDQFLSNSAIYEHRCLENIKKLYKSSDKFYDQQQYKFILEEAMVLNTEGLMDSSLMDVVKLVTM